MIALIVVLIFVVCGLVLSLCVLFLNNYAIYSLSKEIRPQLKKMLKKNWVIKEICWFTADKIGSQHYKFYVELYNIHSPDRTNGHIMVNKKIKRITWYRINDTDALKEEE